MRYRAPAPVRSLATLLLAIGVATCSDTPIAAVRQGASPAHPGNGSLSLSPVFSTTARQVAQRSSDFTGLNFDNVHVVIRGFPDSTIIVIDTTVTFGPNSSDVTLDLTVPVSSDGQKFDAGIDYRSGTTVVFHGGGIVASHPAGQPGSPVVITINYVGPGANVAAIHIAPQTVAIIGTGSQTFSVTATDSTGAAIAVPPLAWTFSNPGVGTVSGAGVFSGLGSRGNGTVTAATPTGISDNAQVTVSLPPSAIVVVSGAGQSGKAGAQLAAPAVVQVNANDGLGVAGVNVVFSAPAGGKVGTTSATTDANGRASSTLTLGTASGPQSFAAVSAGFSVGIPETATASDPATITIVSGNNQSDTVHKALAPLVVKVVDVFNNPVSNSVVTWTRTAGTGTLGSATSTTDANGQATNSYTLGTTLGAESVTAAATGVSAVVTFNFTTKSGGASKIAIVSGDGQTGTPGSTLAAPFVVKVTDATGNAVSGGTVSWSSAAGSLPVSATLSDTAGKTSNTLRLPNTASTVTTIASLASGQSVTFTATAQAGPAAALAFGAQPANSSPATTLSPVTVQIVDAQGNLATSTASVTIALGNNPTTAVLSGTLTRAAVNGVATFNDLKVDRAGAGFTLVATSAGLTNATSTAFTIATASAQLVLVPATPTSFIKTAGTAVANPPSIRAIAANGTGIAGAVIQIAVTNLTGATVATSTLTADATGTASTATGFTTPDVAGSYTITATSASVPSASVVATLVVNPAAASQIAFLVPPGTQSFTATAGAPITLPTTLQVAIEDAFGNVVPTATNTISLTLVSQPSNPAGTVLGGLINVIPTAGIAVFNNLTINRVGTFQVTAAPGSTTLLLPITSLPINVSAGPATQLAFATNRGTGTANTLMIPPGIVVQILDAAGNIVTGAPNTTVTLGLAAGSVPGAAISTTTGTAIHGVATVTPTFGATTGQYLINAIAATTGLPIQTPVNILDTITVSAVVPAGLRVTLPASPILQARNDSGFRSPIKVQLVDANGASVAQAGVQVLAAIFHKSDTASIVTTAAAATTDATGLADFSTLKLTGSIQKFSIQFTAGTLTPDTTATDSLVAGAVAHIDSVGAASMFQQASSTVITLASPPQVRVTDVSGNPVSGATPGWSKRLPCDNGFGGLTVGPVTNASGIASAPTISFTAATPMSCAFTAGVSGAPETVVFPVIIGLTGGNTWLGTTSSAWETATNWSKGAVPTSTDNVYIPSHTFNIANGTQYPVIASSPAIASLTTEVGASASILDLTSHVLTVGGSVTAGSTIGGGTGALLQLSPPVVAGPPPTSTISGTLPPVQIGTLGCSAIYQIGGLTRVAGNLTTNCPLLVTTNSLDLTSVGGGGDLAVVGSGAYLDMNSASASVSVRNASFTGGPRPTTHLQAGTLTIAGHLVTDTTFGAFGTHTTVFSNPITPGVTDDSIFGPTPSSVVSFGNVTSLLSSGHELYFESNGSVGGNLIVAANGAVATGIPQNANAITVAGTVNTGVNSDLSGVANLVIAGSTFPSFGGASAQNVELIGNGVTMNGNSTLTGQLDVEAPLTIGIHALNVGGDIVASAPITTTSGSLVTIGGNLLALSSVTTANGASIKIGKNLDVAGSGQMNLTTGGSVVVDSTTTFEATAVSSITGGSLEFQGDLNVVSSDFITTFSAAGTTVKFTGTGAQTVTIGQPSSTKFYDVSVTNPVGVTFQSDATAAHSLDVGAGAKLIMGVSGPFGFAMDTGAFTAKFHAGSTFSGGFFVLQGLTQQCTYDTSALVSAGVVQFCTSGSVP